MAYVKHETHSGDYVIRLNSNEMKELSQIVGHIGGPTPLMSKLYDSYYNSLYPKEKGKLLFLDSPFVLSGTREKAEISWGGIKELT